MNEIKINGCIWKNVDFSQYAVELFRVRIKEENVYDSYKGVQGVVVFRVLRSSTEDIYEREVMVQFATKSQTDETPYIRVFDLHRNETDSLDIKVIMEDDYAVVYGKCSHKWDSINHQITFASQPGFVEDTYDIKTIPVSVFNNPSTSSWKGENRFMAAPSISFNANVCQTSTEPSTHSLTASYLTGCLLSLRGSVYVYNTVNVGDTLFTLSKGVAGKKDIIYVDIYEGYPSGALDFSDRSKVKRVPLEVNTDGTVKALETIATRTSMKIDSILTVRNEK